MSSIIKRLPTLGSLSLVWRVIGFIMLLMFIIPLLYGEGMVFFGNKLPPFVPQDTITKLMYGSVYGFWSIIEGFRGVTGLVGGAYIARGKIADNSIIDVSTNLSQYVDYQNSSINLDVMFTNITSVDIGSYYGEYCDSFGINKTTSWSINLYVVSKDGQYLIADCYIENIEGNFTTSITTEFGTKPQYGIIVTEDIIDSLTAVFSNGQFDWTKITLMVMGTIRNGNIVFYSI
jgi:hypothetical protein